MTPRSFDDDQALLADVLADVVRSVQGEDALALHRESVALAGRARSGETDADTALAALVDELDPAASEVLVRSLTRWFQLTNLAEDNERVRRLHRREVREAPTPRAGSLAAAVARLAASGMGPEELSAHLATAEVRLVLTAHPTEARRRTTIDKLARVFGVLRELDRAPGEPGAEPEARRRIAATVQELWGSDEIRATDLTVLDEVQGGLVYFTSTLADVVPVVYRDLETAIAHEYPGEEIDVPPLLSFGSWIGGDRDGNPFVTPPVTLEALRLMRERCLRLLESRVELLAGRVSLSERLTGPAPGLREVLEAGEERFPELAARLRDLNPEEPYRRAFTLMRERLRASAAEAPGGYGGPGELLADLRAAQASLQAGPGALTARGDLQDVIRQVEVFGFHFARLDIRQHAARHRSALDEILAELRICDGYGGLGEDERRALLARELADRRPLVPEDISGFGEETQEVVATFRMLREALRGVHRGAVESYIVSGTEGPCDLLEVLLLMQEAGLARADGEDAALRIVPLFEAGATLDASAATMDTLLSEPAYRTALRASGDEQEVMVGYSDSNKDVGYLAASWATYRAQVRTAATIRDHGARWVFFHGRGGAVGRGGGPTSQAILALPAGTVGARVKMTEQGEVLATKYAVGEIAHRELELATSTTLVSELLHAEPVHRERHEQVLEAMAARSAEAYRALVHDDADFAAFFAAVTPIEEISRLRLGSRPAKRRAGGGIDQLRAIPWVFSWTQARIVLPAWYGLGTALAAAREEHGVECLREMADDWPFFAGVLSNAEMAVAKADARIARHYVELWDDVDARERLWAAVSGELDRTTSELLLVRGEDRLLDAEPVLQRSIERRNPFVDPLSFVQVEVLRRLRADTEGDPDPALARLSLLTINGIASGLRNTG